MKPTYVFGGANYLSFVKIYTVSGQLGTSSSNFVEMHLYVSCVYDRIDKAMQQ